MSARGEVGLFSLGDGELLSSYQPRYFDGEAASADSPSCFDVTNAGAIAIATAFGLIAAGQVGDGELGFRPLETDGERLFLRGLAWSNAGNRLAGASVDESGSIALVLLGRDGGFERSVPLGPSASDQQNIVRLMVSWSSDDRSVAVSADAASAPDYQGGFIIELDTERVTPLPLTNIVWLGDDRFAASDARPAAHEGARPADLIRFQDGVILSRSPLSPDLAVTSDPQPGILLSRLPARGTLDPDAGGARLLDVQGRWSGKLRVSGAASPLYLPGAVGALLPRAGSGL